MSKPIHEQIAMGAPPSRAPPVLVRHILEALGIDPAILASLEEAEARRSAERATATSPPSE